MLQNDFVSDSDDGEIDSTACDDQHRHEEHGQVNSQCGIRDNGKIVGITSTSKCNKCFLQSDLKVSYQAFFFWNRRLKLAD